MTDLWMVQDRGEEGYTLGNGWGYICGKDEAIAIAKGLIKFAKNHYKEIDEHNRAKDQEAERIRSTHNIGKVAYTEKKSHSTAYLYLIECGGKYKIGCSQDVERRIKELDKRPFPATIVAVSRELENAFSYEIKIHKSLDKYRICGEWYELGQELSEKVAIYISQL